MNGKLVGGAIVAIALVAGAALYYLQIYHFYETVSDDTEIRLTLLDGSTEPILADGIEAIDANSSPIRFRACFTTPDSIAMLTETYVVYPEPEPLTGPGWFDCYDAGTVSLALERGEAVAFLGAQNSPYGIDRVVVIASDGRGWAWDQINACGAQVFDGKPPPEGCPPPPG